MHHFRLALLVAAIGAAAIGCPQCAPDQVGAGVARLTIRNVGAMTSLVNADTTCGFASDVAKGTATFTGDVGGLGSLTLTVTDCEIDAGTETVVSTDCNGAKTTAAGKVKISATRVLTGVVTGDAENPILPAGPDSLQINITAAAFTDFVVTSSTSEDKLTMKTGTISAVVSPRLAVAESTGACAVPTSNTQFTAVKYGASTVAVDSPDNKFDADVTTSNIAAQNGNGPGGENAISGTMTVFGSVVNDVAGPDAGLDPDYDAAKFITGYSCADDFKDPESYDCPFPTQLVADGAARLSIQMLGAITSLVDADTACGFASTGAQATADVSGTPGGSGTIITTVSACEIVLTAPQSGADDCGGNHSIVEGKVTVTGTKAVSGRLTGKAETPVIPDDDRPATFAFTSIVVEDFKVSSSASTNSLLAKSGTLTGSVTPRTALTTLDSDGAGSCSVATPNALFSDVKWDAADLLVTGDAGSFGLVVDAASLNAVNGNFDASTNTFSGTVTVAGNVLSVPSANDGLDPAFDQAAFDASWQCNPDLVSPASFQCKFVQTIGVGAAQLSMQAFGTVLGLVDADTSCGFASGAVGGTPTFAGGVVGDDHVAATFTLPTAGCTIDLPQESVISTDCLGHTTSVAGTIVVKGTKTVTGFHTGDPTEPVIPTSSQGAVFDLQITLTNFHVSTNPAGAATLTVHSGTLAGTASPVLALDPTTGACSIGTPNIAFSDVAWTAGNATLVADGAAFDMALASTDMAATNGVVGAAINTLSGTLSVDGNDVTLGGPLNPDFVRADFDTTYQCAGNGNPQLVGDEGCNFRQVLGNAAARLLVKATGVAASVLKANPNCGPLSAGAGAAPVVTSAGGGLGDVLFTAGADCVSGFQTDSVLSTTCQGTTTHALGAFTTSAMTLDVAGALTGDSANPVLPVTNDATVIELTGASFASFTYYDELVDNSIPVQATFTGAIDAVVTPITGVSIADTAAAGTDSFSEATPIAGFSAVSTDAANMVIVTEGKTFNITIDSAQLDAFAGSFGGASNSISGDIVVDGTVVTLDPVLVTPFSQAGFDASYSCDPDLREVVPAQ